MKLATKAIDPRTVARAVQIRLRATERAGDRLAAAVRHFSPWVDENDIESADAEELRAAYRAYTHLKGKST